MSNTSLFKEDMLFAGLLVLLVIWKYKTLQHIVIPMEYIAEKIGEDNMDDFHLWAFGEGFSIRTSINSIPSLWNRMHPEAPIYWGDSYSQSLDLMITQWVKR